MNSRGRYPRLDPVGLHSQASLPYGLTVQEVRAAGEAAHKFLFDINRFLVRRGYDRLEDMLLGNSFAGILSEVLVKALADNSSTLTRNLQVGGYPDLIRQGQYPANMVLRGTEGIEVKASKQSGGWQGHNPEVGWVMIFRYAVDTTSQPVERRAATRIIEILAADLGETDWSFSGRSATSRRTITASINKGGMAKLRANPIYREPNYQARSRG